MSFVNSWNWGCPMIPDGPCFCCPATEAPLFFCSPGSRSILAFLAARRPDLRSPPSPESRDSRPAGQPPNRTAETGRSALRVFLSQFSASKRVIIRFFRIFASRKTGLEDPGWINPGNPDSITVRCSLRTAPKPHIQKLWTFPATSSLP